jgi:hypothetical protein
MEYAPGMEVRVTPDDLRRSIQTCRDGANRVYQILEALRQLGQTSQKWANDTVSHDVANHYTLQLWSGAYCTYSALSNYHNELRSTIEVLQQTLADYNTSDAAAAELLEQL